MNCEEKNCLVNKIVKKKVESSLIYLLVHKLWEKTGNHYTLCWTVTNIKRIKKD